ncbi:MAG TPA: hypothetical protein PK876_08505 [Elusimicrobiota bacterium]|nr:hypothetical protein [Elusimicrobiota bacterium]
MTSILILSTMTSVAFAGIRPAPSPQKEDGASFNLLDAKDRGTFNIGPSKGNISTVSDEKTAQTVLQFDYNVPPKSIVGVWTKNYPTDLKPTTANGVKIGVNVLSPDQTRQISVVVELKGTKEVQRIPLQLKPGWNRTENLIEWKKIGDLKEAVFVVSSTKDGQTVAGSLHLNLDFAKIGTVPKKKGSSSFGLLDGKERGVFNIGSSKGDLSLIYDDAAQRDVLKFNYRTPAKTVVGVWTKGYPSELNENVASGVKVGVKPGRAEQAQQVSLSLEIKGSKETQAVPLAIQAGWNSVEEPLDWAKIGKLKEVVFVVTPNDSNKTVSGTLSLDLNFVKLKPKETPDLAGTPAPLSLLSAAERGVFNMGPAQGTLGVMTDGTEKKDVLKFDYSAPVGSVIGIWTKAFPPEIRPDLINAALIDVNLPEQGQENSISVAVEIKGMKSTQRIPLQLRSGRNSIREFIDWESIGKLTETVVVINPVAKDQTVSGTIHLNIGFIQSSDAPRRGPTAGRKIGLVLLCGLIGAALSFLRGRVFVRRPADPSGESAGCLSSAPTSVLGHLRCDLVFGSTILLTLISTLGIYLLGTLQSPHATTIILLLALGGALIANLWKSALTGKHLTPVETFQNIFLTGLLAATSSSQVLWQNPATWSQLLLKSNLTAALAFLIYHVSNACTLKSTGQHIRLASGSLIVATPYLFGLLLLLQNATLLQNAVGPVVSHFLSAGPLLLADIGRFLVIFLFNEAVANGISLASKGKIVKSLNAHLTILLVSAGVVISPSIADWGSSPLVSRWPEGLRILAGIATAMLSQAGLWVEVYLITGMILDGTYSFEPTGESIARHVQTGLGKGMAYSGFFMTFLYALNLLFHAPAARTLMTSAPLSLGLLFGALVFPFAKTIIESFDGSMSFFERMRYSCKKPMLYARGAIAGWGLAYGLSHGAFQWATPERMGFGLAMGFLASAGASLLRDTVNTLRRRGQLQSWRVYFIDAILGGFIGGMTAFYLDASQVPVIIDKFNLYLSSGLQPKDYTIYALLSKWGRVDLGAFSGGVKLFFNEALAGVITWSVAAWLFAINRTLMEAYFQRDKAPIKHLLSRAGFVELVVNMIHVLRWGLWMSPIINTFLRMMGEATWYNQDGLIRSVMAIYQNITLSPAEFQTWSLNLFISLLAVDAVRILIWIDHMGLRVATLVNLSFIGMNKLDDRIARFIGPDAAQRYIPEGVKRFTTWAPLLIPFYIPRGTDWEFAWSKSLSIQNAAAPCALLPALQSLSASQIILGILSGLLICTGICAAIRLLMGRAARRQEKIYELGNREYKVFLKENGESYSEILRKGYDLTRRSYDVLHPCGRALFVVEPSQAPDSSSRLWPVLGNFPKNQFAGARIERGDGLLRVTHTHHNAIRTVIDIRLPDDDTPAEIWTITLDNMTDTPRSLKVVPYLEWVLDKPDADKGHTQYNRLFPEMEYLDSLNCIIAWSKHSKSMGLIASDVPPEGFLTSRMDFIGRARSLWTPRVLETLDFMPAQDTPACPTFDPIGSLLLNVSLPAKSSQKIHVMVGYSKTALDAVSGFLHPQPSAAPRKQSLKKKSPLIGHGEILPKTPQPYSEFTQQGNRLLVRTPYTPRPYDHAMSNAIGHTVMVTNRGLHTSMSGNSQQNPITPDWPDTVTREVSAEAIYLYDPTMEKWYCPTLHPLNDHSARHECEFGVDGTATFRMTQDTLSTELTVFVPPDEPAGLYLLTIKNNDEHPRRLRVAPYFQIVLTGQAERRHGPLKISEDKDLNALFFENPRNTFRWGPAFASLSIPVDRTVTQRGRFFGTDRGVTHPYFVEKGEPDLTQISDDRPIAGFLGTVDIPARGEKTIAVILGQADTRKQASSIIHKYKHIETAVKSLEKTRQWWLSLMETVKAETDHPEYDWYLNWLKYQGIAERIWARRGFYQTSGAYGFRDQLQDSVNLIWVDPALARKQIILHASQQFIEGDVVHWFHTLHDGRTAFSNRSHASDNLLWLAWGASEYVKATGDETLLDEMTSYLESENPFQPLPKMKHGWGSIYLRSAKKDSVYRHCMKSIDVVLEKRMGKNGLPLIGTGDWNDGLDEIGSQGRGESVWLGFFLYYILNNMLPIIEKRCGAQRKDHYARKKADLGAALEKTWRGDRYLRAIHDDGTEIGLKDSGVWEIDALTAAWAVMSGINWERNVTVFNTALQVLEKENVILLGWPALREDTKPFLGRSSHYPEGVRENGMYSHGVQWLVGAARLLAEHFEKEGDRAKAKEYRAHACRLWTKISPLSHVTPGEIEIYGGQPNKQAADMLTTFDQGRMIWHGYTGAAGWMLRQFFEGVVGARLVNNQVVLPSDLQEPRGDLTINRVYRDVVISPLEGPTAHMKERNPEMGYILKS